MTGAAVRTRLVLFDLDGTLVDTAEDLATALIQCQRRRGLAPTPLDELRPWTSHGARGLIRCAFGIGPSPPPGPCVVHRYAKCVAGSYADGGQSTAAAGFHATKLLPVFVGAYGVKMQPTRYSFPSGAALGHSFRVEHWLANASPVGYGCVGERFAYAACELPVLYWGTFFSVIPISGFPVARSRM